MDKNTITGLVIIFLILIGFSYLTRPSKEQVAEMQRKQDSIARVDRLRAQELAAQQQAQKTPDNTTAANPLATKSDSIFVQNDTENKIITLENDKIKLHISTLGGRIVYVDLKEYRTHDSLPLVLWKNGETAFGMNFYARNQEINTEKFFFTPSTTETTLYASLCRQQQIPGIPLQVSPGQLYDRFQHHHPQYGRCHCIQFLVSDAFLGNQYAPAGKK